MKPDILVRIPRPEGYEDVADELVFFDFLENPKAFEPELVKDIDSGGFDLKTIERVEARA